MRPGGSNSTNDTPARSNPKANFMGVEGSRDPSRAQIHANIGASMMTNIAWIDTNQLAGKVKPNATRSTCRSANRFRVEAACS